PARILPPPPLPPRRAGGGRAAVRTGGPVGPARLPLSPPPRAGRADRPAGPARARAGPGVLGRSRRPAAGGRAAPPRGGVPLRLRRRPAPPPGGLRPLRPAAVDADLEVAPAG